VADNRPFIVSVPQYGPDAYSRGMSGANASRANPISAASNGMGVTRYETTTDAWFPARQNFRGITGAIRRAAVKILPDSGQLPDASAQVDPILLTLSANQLARM
jgi:hypothetical protein